MLGLALPLLCVAVVRGILNVLLGLTTIVPFIAIGAMRIGLVPRMLQPSVSLAAYPPNTMLLLTVLAVAWSRGEQEAPVMNWIVLCPISAT